MAPGRMGPPAATSYTLLGIALMLIAGRGKTRRFAPGLGMIVGGIAMLSLVGYLFGSAPLFAIARYTGIAMQTATVVLALAVGVIASVPEHEPVRTLGDNSAAGVLARRFLPLIFALPIALGWLRVIGQKAGWFDAGLGTALLVLTLIVFLCALLWWCIVAVAHREEALRKSEQAEASRRAELEALTRRLDQELSDTQLLQRITKAAEEKRRISEERLSLALRGGQLGAWETDLETGDNFWGEQMPTLLGVAPENAERESKRWNEFVHPDDRQRVAAAFQAASQDGAAPFHEEFRVTRADGSIRWFASRGIVVADKGRHRRMIGVVQDVTERKTAEERQGRLAAIVEYSRDAVISKTVDGIVTSWNPGAEALFGYSASEMIGRSIRQIIPLDFDQEEDLVLSRLRAGESVHLETVRMRKNSQRVPVSITCSPIKDAAGRLIGASKIARDITEQKEMEDKLRQTQQELMLHATDLEGKVAERTVKLQEMINELQQLSYSITHDMRAPLRAMAAFAQLLLEESSANRDGSRAQDYCRRILTAASRLDNLIQDALSYSKAVLQQFSMEPVDISRLLREILETYPNLHPDRAEIEIEGNLPVVMGNQSLLTQCFSNLLGNAVKFVAAGIKPRVRLWAEATDSTARIWIEDNGIGIPEHAQPRLFGMFQKLDNQYEGTGVGLAIVRKTAERMGGKVGVHSAEGSGSRFWVELPIAPTATKPVQPAATA